MMVMMKMLTGLWVNKILPLQTLLKVNLQGKDKRERERERNKYKAGGLIDIIHGYLRSLIWKYGCDIQGVGMKSDSLHAMGGVNPFLLMLPLQSRPESWMIELVQWRPGSRETRQKGLKRACLFVTPLMPSSQH